MAVAWQGCATSNLNGAGKSYPVIPKYSVFIIRCDAYYNRHDMMRDENGHVDGTFKLLTFFGPICIYKTF